MRNRKGHLQTPVFSKQRFPSQHSWSTVVGALHQIQVPVSGKGASCLIDHIMVASNQWHPVALGALIMFFSI